ncbi:MAG: DUF3858 domain-containing protein [candidate division Zixibacteria bacterium]|nr:DUF3858 domain-containing protein [candidate division Zixibacteria bacterium]
MKRLSILLVTGLLVGLLITPSMARKKEEDREMLFEWEEVSQQDWDIKNDSAYRDDKAVMIFEKIYADDKDLQENNFYRTIYRRIRILNEEGRQWADVDVPFLDESQKVLDIKARTILPGGDIIELAQDQIKEKDMVRVEGKRIRQKSFSLPGVTHDCLIEYVIMYELPNVYGIWNIQKNIKLISGEYHWEFFDFIKEKIHFYPSFFNPYGHEVAPQYIWEGLTDNYRVRKLPLEDPEKILFQVNDIAAIDDEPYADFKCVQPARLIYYYGPDCLPAVFWGGLTVFIDRILEYYGKEDKEVMKVVEAFAALPTDEEKIEAAYNWLQQNIRNTSFEEVPELEEQNKKKKFKKKTEMAENIDEIIKHGYGSKIEINFLFYTMLKRMDIEARLALAVDRLDDYFNFKLKFWQFDRTLVVVPDEKGDWTFYSPGEKFLPAAAIPWFDEGETAFINDLNKQKYELPFSPAERNVIKKTYAYTFDDEFEISGTVAMACTGHKARTYRLKIHGEDEAGRGEILKEEIKEILPEAETDSLNFENIENSNDSFRITCRTTYAAVEAQGDRLLFKPCRYLSECENPFLDKKRDHDILFPYAYKMEDSASFELPEGWTVEALPADTVIENPVGRCEVQFVSEGNTVSVKRSFTLNKARCPKTQYSYVRHLFASRQELSDKIIVLKTV